MNYINIGINLKCRDQESGLIRRLTELSERLRITLMESSSEDCLEESSEEHNIGNQNNHENRESQGNDKTKLKEEFDFVITDEIMYRHFPVSVLLNHIVEVYEKNSGNIFMEGRSHGMMIYGVRSKFGGSGSTSIALTLARILAGRRDEITAFISTGREEDIRLYTQTDNIPCRSQRELEYVLANGVTGDLKNYIYNDRYGLLIICARCNLNKLLRRLERELGVSLVIIDFGNSNVEIDCHRVINILAMGDSRTEIISNVRNTECMSGYDGNLKKDDDSKAVNELNEVSWQNQETRMKEGEFYALNKAMYRNSKGNIFKIPFDEESFKVHEKNIEIAMDRVFAAAVGDMARVVAQSSVDGCKGG